MAAENVMLVSGEHRYLKFPRSQIDLLIEWAKSTTATSGRHSVRPLFFRI